jgi:hypothetical protein
MERVPWHFLSENQYFLYGVLHALTVVAALRRPRPILQSALFVFAGAVLSVGAVFVGMLAGGLLGNSWAPYSMPAFGSAVGALTYALVLRFLWLPQLPGISIAFITAGCAIATLVGLVLAEAATPFVNIILTLAWWGTFSGLLWSQVSRPWHLTMRWSGS